MAETKQPIVANIKLSRLGAGSVKGTRRYDLRLFRRCKFKSCPVHLSYLETIHMAFAPNTFPAEKSLRKL